MTFILPLDDAQVLASAAIVVTEKRGSTTTPVLEAACVRDGYFTATDRYRALRARIEDTEADLLIPRDALEWVVAIKPRSLRHNSDLSAGSYLIEFAEAENGKASAVSLIWLPRTGGPVTERSQMFDAVSGGYPAVSRLFRNFAPAADGERSAVTLGCSRLSDILAWGAKFKDRQRNSPVLLELGGGANTPLRVTTNGVEFIVHPLVVTGDTSTASIAPATFPSANGGAQ